MASFNFNKKIATIKNKKKVVKRKPSPTSSPHLLVFNNYASKKIDKKYISNFWENYFSKKINVFIEKRESRKKATYISEYNKRIKIFPLSPKTLCTVRIINSKSVKTYKLLHIMIKDIISKSKFKRSELILVDLLDIKPVSKTNSAVLERVFPSISIFDLKQSVNYGNYNYPFNRYTSSFLETLSKNRINKDLFIEKLNLAMDELKTNKKLYEAADISDNNLIILGYNQKSGVVKLGLIDFFPAFSKSLE